MAVAGTGTQRTTKPQATRSHVHLLLERDVERDFHAADGRTLLHVSLGRAYDSELWKIRA